MHIRTTVANALGLSIASPWQARDAMVNSVALPE